ncbi:MAG TPA: VCBS repeat-containing protein, partial [Micromonosporaceae bacterium]
MRTRRSVVTAAIALLIGSGIVPIAASAASFSAVSDFNCDGESDVAVAEPGAHRFHVLYGHYGRLTTTSPADQMYTSSNGSGQYGATLVTADFNHDGCADLAVGDPDN